MKTTVIFAGLVALSACAGHQQQSAQLASPETLRQMPGWYRKPPKSDDKWIVAPATADSRDLQVALNKAELEGRVALAGQLEVKLGGLQRRFVEETGLGADATALGEYEQTAKAVISQVLIGSHAREQQFSLNAGTYRAWVLMELPVGEASKALLERLKQQEAIVTRIRASAAFKELNAEVEKYEQRKDAGKP
jgi:hypothetical protein